MYLDQQYIINNTTVCKIFIECRSNELIKLKLVYVSDKFKFALFADDTNVLYSSTNYEFVENTVLQ